MIDDLVRYCLTEVAYDGELGCSIDRLKELITLFAEKQAGLNSKNVPRPEANEKDGNKASRKQNVDDAYCAYVYSLIVKHPSIIIGTVPTGTPPVWIAPTPAKRGEGRDIPPPVSLNIIEGAKEKTMQELKQTYGSTLRIAADKMTCFVTITGSHNRPSKLSDMVYSTLQIITRTRDAGIAIKDLGPITNYDPKSIFYQIAQLVELNLVVKVSNYSSINWAVHRRFYDSSPLWQRIKTGQAPAIDDDEDAEEDAGENRQESESLPTGDMVANVPLLRYRVLKLLKRSTNYTHQYNNLILGAGYQQPNKTQRRFFTARVVEMIEEGLIDKIAVPTPRGAAVCVQLTQKGAEHLEKGDSRQVDVEENDYILPAPTEEEEYRWTEDNMPNRMVPLQRQIISLLEDSPNGMIIKDISQSLGFFDRRTIEQMLTRLCSRVPPRHLADLHPVTVMETIGKMRRQRYFILRYYRQMLQDQSLSDERLDWIHMDDISKFADIDKAIFWKDQDDIDKHINEYQVNKARKANSSPSKPRKKVYKNVGPDGLPKRGRPRKPESEKAKRSGKSTTTNPPNESKKPPAKRKSKAPDLNEGTLADEIDEIESDDEDIDNTLGPPPRKKTKGDPSKVTASDVTKPGRASQGIDAQRGISRRRQVDKPGNFPKTSRAEVSTPAAAAKDPVATVAESEDSQQLSTPNLVDDASSTKQTLQELQKGENRSKKRDRFTLEEGPEYRPLKRRKVAEMSSVDPQTTPANEVDRNPLPAQEETPSSSLQNPPIETPPITPASQPSSPSKRRQKQPKPRATNVSALRRLQEILDVLQARGGIAQCNTEFAVHLRDHMIELAEKGAKTVEESGFLPDKKTISRSLTALEEKGLVKVLKTAIVDPTRKTSLQQPTTIVYLPDLPQDVVDEFVTSLQKPYRPTSTPSVPRLVEEPVEFSKVARVIAPRSEPSTSKPQERDLLVGPRQPFLEDRQTLAQLYGFLLGKCRRAQELHLFTFSHIISSSPASTVISVQEKIVSADYWTEDFPLGSFCAIIPAHTYIPYLESIQNDPQSLNQPLKTLDSRLQAALKVKHAKTRVRLVELLTILVGLKLISPLVPDPNGSIKVMDTRAISMPKVFRSTRLSPSTKELAPFWQFNETAPLWFFSLTQVAPQGTQAVPSFYKDMSVTNIEDAVTYWSTLQKLCNRDGSLTPSENTETRSPRFDVSASLIATLCNRRAWTAEYRLSRLQEEYLKQMVDIHNKTTPLSDSTPERLAQASFITCAPQQVVCNYFSAEEGRLLRASERLESKKQVHAGGSSVRNLQRSMAEKAERHLKAINDKWELIVARAKGDEELQVDQIDQLRTLRSRYITVGGAVNDEDILTLIKNVIRNPIEDAKKRHKKVPSGPTKHLPFPPASTTLNISSDINRVFQTASKTNAVPSAPKDSQGYPDLPPVVARQYSKTVSELVEEMGTRGEDTGKQSRNSKKSHQGESLDKGKEPTMIRRKRFHWNEEYDELLKDAVAVIRARCRGKGKGILWQPIEAVFPPVRANNLRTRFQKYAVQPGAGAYMERLERAWYNLWQTHKGRPELPDEDPSKAEGCDLIKHVDFLRKHLDKRQLTKETGDTDLSNSGMGPQTILPATITDLQAHYHIKHVGSSTLETCIQQYWGETPGYLSERQHVLSVSTFAEYERIPSPARPLKLSLTESAVQLVVSTEEENYNEGQATALLRPFGDDLVKQATFNLWKRGTIIKASGIGAGRTYHMSDANIEALSGTLSLSQCEEAAACEHVCLENADEWTTWPTVPTEGDMAAMLRRASKHGVDFRITLPDLKLARDIANWTSRKIQDEMLECQIELNFSVQDDLATSEEDQNMAGGTRKQPNTSIQSLLQGRKAQDSHEPEADTCCLLRNRDERLINCSKCLGKLEEAVLKKMTRGEKKMAGDLVKRLTDAKENGVEAQDIWQTSEKVNTVIAKLTSSTPPLAFWSGYSTSHLVSARYLGHYCIFLGQSENPEGGQSNIHLIEPRRWINLKGATNESVWRSALRAVVSMLVLRPLVDQTRLIESFHRVYTRLDLLDVLRYLEDNDIITREKEVDIPLRNVGEMSFEEENRTLWKLSATFEWQQLL